MSLRIATAIVVDVSGMDIIIVNRWHDPATNITGTEWMIEDGDAAHYEETLDACGRYVLNSDGHVLVVIDVEPLLGGGTMYTLSE